MGGAYAIARFQNRSPAWRWLDVRGADTRRPISVERAGWRIVGQAGRYLGQDQSEWAWIIHVRNRSELPWSGTARITFRLIDDGGMVVSHDQRIDTLRIPAGRGFRVWGTKVVPSRYFQSHLIGRLTTSFVRPTEEDVREFLDSVGSVGGSQRVNRLR